MNRNVKRLAATPTACARAACGPRPFPQGWSGHDQRVARDRAHAVGVGAKRANERGGYSLLELVIGLAASVVLLGGMASAVAVSSRSLTLADTGSGARAVSTDVQRDFLADLQRATGFTERTATAVTFTVPDRTGDGRPETLRYAWSGTAGAPLTLQMNGGSVQNLATNVQQWQLSYRMQSVTAPVVPDESPPNSGRLLFVSAGTYTPPTFTEQLNGQPGKVSVLPSEGPKVSLFQSWGFEVSLIAATQPSTDFTNAFAKNDVVFVSSEADAMKAEPYLSPAAIGIVNENPSMQGAFAFYVGTGTVSDQITQIGSSVHYITTGYTAGQKVSIVNTTTILQAFTSTRTNDMSILGTNPSNGAVNFATLAAGRTDVEGKKVPARRVQVPWAMQPFNANTLTADGQNLLKASLLWAAGNGTDGDPSLLKVGLSTTATEAGHFDRLSTIMVASPITMTVKGEMLELSAYIDCENLPIRLAIYSDGSGKPLTRLAQTGMLTGSADPAWVTGTIPAIVLNPGTYWLAASLSDFNQDLHYAKPNNFSTSHITKMTFSNGFPATWTPGPGGGLTFTTASTQLLMYGSYVLAK